MKAVILGLLLTAVAAAHANLVVVPSPEGCKQAKEKGDKVVMDACAKMAKGEPVDLACPIQGGCKTK